MLRRVTATAVLVLLLVPTIAVAAEYPDNSTGNVRIDKLRTQAEALRRKGDNTVVTLNDGTKFKGQIAALTDDGLTLRTKSGEEQQFSFEQVRSVKKSGLSRGAKVGIGIAVGFVTYAGLMCGTGHCGD